MNPWLPQLPRLKSLLLRQQLKLLLSHQPREVASLPLSKTKVSSQVKVNKMR